MKSFFNRHAILIIFVLTSCLFILQRMFFPPTGDTLFNFEGIRIIVSGYVLYKDINIIVTPLFYFLGALFAWAFGNSFLSYNIFCSIISGGLFTMYYLLIRELKVGRKTRIALLTLARNDCIFVYN